jgi:hypothetical protein
MKGRERERREGGEEKEKKDRKRGGRKEMKGGRKEEVSCFPGNLWLFFPFFS